MAPNNIIKIWIFAVVASAIYGTVGAMPCFPATAFTTLESGAQKQMSVLRVGDRVAVGGGKYSEVIMFSHRIVDGTYEFVELHAGASVLRVTTGHLIYASGGYIPAGNVKVGDTLELANGASRAVTAVKKVMDKGLYNPQTLHGDIIVNGIRAATFTPKIQCNLAEPSLSPLRTMLDRLGLTCTLFESITEIASNSVPSGRIKV